MKKMILIAVLGASAVAAQTEYFPLHVGNQWIYRSNIDVRQMEITRTGVFDGKQYALLRNAFSGDAWLRFSEDGTLLAYDPGTGREQPWVAFATPEGESFETALDPCNRRGVVVSRKAKHSSPVGEFYEALRIRYPAANCADAGLESEIYGPYIGLVQRSHQTIVGPRVYDLIYARVGGVTVVSAREVHFGLTLDQSVYAGQPLLARITLRHSQSGPIELTFPTGQTYEIVIRHESGEVVFRWSAGKVFTQAIRRMAFGPVEHNWVESIRLERDGKPLPAGKYVAEAWLTTVGVRQYAASVGFEIAEVRTQGN